MSHCVFTSVEAAGEALGRLYQAELVQMDPGGVKIDIRASLWGRCSVTQVETTRQLVSTGVRRTDLLTVTPITEENAGGRYRGLDLQPGTLLILDPGGESVQQVAAGQRQLAFSIPLDLFQRIAEVDCGGMQDRFCQWRAVRPSPQTFAEFVNTIRRSLHFSAAGCIQPQHHVRPPEADDESLVSVVLESITGGDARLETATAKRRRAIARQAEDLIRVDLTRAPSLLELCEATGASRRMLFYAFAELYGVTPAAYAKKLRLHAVRQALRTPTDSRSIGQLIQEFGFKHAGQFAIDYEKSFGESPSLTRRQSRYPRL